MVHQTRRFMSVAVGGCAHNRTQFGKRHGARHHDLCRDTH